MTKSLKNEGGMIVKDLLPFISKHTLNAICGKISIYYYNYSIKKKFIHIYEYHKHTHIHTFFTVSLILTLT